MELNIGQQERPVLKNTEQALQRASAMPYNNAAQIYETAGEAPDARLGGSCLFKLSVLKKSLPVDAKNVRFITSMIGHTTHYAMLVDIDGITYYLDPFLWQKNLLPLSNGNIREVKTLEEGWLLQKEKDEKGALLVLSLVDTAQKRKRLITHRFTRTLDFLPSSSALPLTPNLPSFMIQIPSFDGQHFYKAWYSKDRQQLDDIWVTDTVSGERTKITRDGVNSELRPSVVRQIEKLLGVSEQELCDYFARAHELEIELSHLIPTSGADMPHENR